MLWNLRSEETEKFFRCWNTCVKLIYEIPRNTYTYLIEGFFASNQSSLRNQVLARYPKFYRNLLNSPSREVRFLSRIVKCDPRSTSCKNLQYLREVTKLSNPEQYGASRIKMEIHSKDVPENERWRLGLLDSLFKVKLEKFLRVEDTRQVCAMIESLCST